MNGRVVFVTGGAAYIGSRACKAVPRAGYLPVTYDGLAYGHEWADILDRSRLDEVIAKHRPGAIMHFAAFAYVSESVTDPGRYYCNNVTCSRSQGITRYLRPTLSRWCSMRRQAVAQT